MTSSSVQQKKILVVEDSFEIRFAVELSLAQEGYEPILAVDGNDGLQKFREHNPDLVILDLRMPGLDGSQVCHAIRESSSVPVIIFSALDQSDEVKKALDAGATDFVLKSSSVDELLRRTNFWLAKQGSGAHRKPEVLQNHDSGSRQLKVMIMDPEFTNATAIAEETTRLGHFAQVIRPSGRDEPISDPDIAVLDYAMPRSIGVDLVEAKSKEQRSRPLGLIIVAKSNPTELRRRLRNCLLLDFVEKPWRRQELPMRISTAFDLYSRRTSLSA